ncbi:hypothetical protein Dsin_019754 [Dipteronia sinensis]|uniref:Uncharacterized protein n=1 Tax=Dipteronia sinensis TaxID=43782 RepID=A0AAE0E343_9ROSI|nr:hypothetical protein Dsin_019754 [Dipteronia sinensis]
MCGVQSIKRDFELSSGLDCGDACEEDASLSLSEASTKVGLFSNFKFMDHKLILKVGLVESPHEELSKALPDFEEGVLSSPSEPLPVDRSSELCFSAREKSCEVAPIPDKGLDFKRRKGRRNTFLMRTHNMKTRSVSVCDAMQQLKPQMKTNVVWNLHDEIAKVIERGLARGFDFNGKKKMMGPELFSGAAVGGAAVALLLGILLEFNEVHGCIFSHDELELCCFLLSVGGAFLFIWWAPCLVFIMTILYNKGSSEATNQLYALACGPDHRVKSYNACIVNGVRFHSIIRDDRRITQNSGVAVLGDHNGDVIDFYGILHNVLHLDYLFGHQVILFQYELDTNAMNKERQTFEVEIHEVHAVEEEDDTLINYCIDTEETSQIDNASDDE